MFENLVTAVTGAGSGLGSEIARAFAMAGARVVAIDRNPEAGRAFVESLAGEAPIAPIFIETDVRSADSVAATFAEVTAQAGPVRILVNSAGVREIAHSLDLSPAEWDNVIGIDLSGTFYCCQAAGRIMRDAGQGGAIVNISSVSGLIGQARRAAYTAAKHGVVGLTKALAKDLATYGIRVNVVCPGTIRTPLTEAYFADESYVRSANASIAQGRLGDPSEIADAVLFLAGDRARHITGVALPVDGGWLAEKAYVTDTGDTTSAFYHSHSTVD
jgi:NAD(P)-dependent dehydrogenase (short-subunit alcohol dehydrogenase family)